MGIVVVAGSADVTAPSGCGLISAPLLTELCDDNAVLVVGEGALLPCNIRVMAAIVNADSSFDTLQLRGTRVITCGLCSRNTISITSRTPEQITLSLNRSIHTTSGLCEPLEQPFQLKSGADDFGYMASFAASLLLGADRCG